MDTLRQQADKLGLVSPITEAILCPGAARMGLLKSLVDRLIQPSQFSYLAQRLLSIEQENQQSEEEAAVQSMHTMLNSLDVAASVQDVQGDTTLSFEERVQFLCRLLQLVSEQDQLQHAGMATADAVHQERHILETACMQAPGLSSETVQLFPADILGISATFMKDVHVVQTASHIWVSEIEEALPAVAKQHRESVHKVVAPSEAIWHQQSHQTIQALQAFLEVSGRFQQTYAQDLEVWCERTPSSHPQRLGARATHLLQHLHKLQKLVGSAEDLQLSYGSLNDCLPPLQVLNAGQLNSILEGGRQELHRLHQQAALLQNAATTRVWGS